MPLGEGRLAHRIKDTCLPEHLLEVGSLFAAAGNIDYERASPIARSRRKQEWNLLDNICRVGRPCIRQIVCNALPPLHVADTGREFVFAPHVFAPKPTRAETILAVKRL